MAWPAGLAAVTRREQSALRPGPSALHLVTSVLLRAGSGPDPDHLGLLGLRGVVEAVPLSLRVEGDVAFFENDLLIPVRGHAAPPDQVNHLFSAMMPVQLVHRLAGREHGPPEDDVARAAIGVISRQWRRAQRRLRADRVRARRVCARAAPASWR